MIRNCWYAVGFSSEFDKGDIQGHTITGRPIVVWRDRDGHVTALDGRCAHKRFPLWEGRLLDNGALECAYHGFAYDTDGHCVAIPALHERTDHIPPTARQYKFPVIEQHGIVWLWPGDREKASDVAPPPTPEIDSPDWETATTEPMEVAANARLLVENLFDLTHFYPLHEGGLGTYADASVPVEIEREVRDGHQVLTTTRRREDFAFGRMKARWFGVERGDNVAVHSMVTPALFHVTERVAPPGRLGTAEERGFVLYQTITPVDEGRHVWRRALCALTNERLGDDPTRSLVDGVAQDCLQVIQEDRWALEQQQRMFAYPDEGYREVHIKTDGPVVMARRILDEMESAERAAGDQSPPDPSPVRSQRPRSRHSQKA